MFPSMPTAGTTRNWMSTGGCVRSRGEVRSGRGHGRAPEDRLKGVKVPVQYKFKSVEVLAGDQSRYREGPFDHLDQTRYRILIWTDGVLENIHRRPNYEYWVQGRFFPRYR